MKSTKSRAVALRAGDYDAMLSRVVGLIDEARRALLQSLRKFDGPQLAVVKTLDAAQLCKEIGVRTVRLGDAVTWADVLVQLK